MNVTTSASHAPPSMCLTVSLRSNLPAPEYRWTCESVAVNGKLPPGLGNGSGAVPSLQSVSMAAIWRVRGDLAKNQAMNFKVV